MPLTSFIERWTASSASERANKDSFLNELCDAIGVPRPDPTTSDWERDLYVFERDARMPHEDGTIHVGKIDLYKHGAFILEAKQGSDKGSKKLGTAKRGTSAWLIEMQNAYGQALGYARSMEAPPVFFIVCDIGYCFDLYACFDGSRNWQPFPNPQTQRIYLTDLQQPEILGRLRGIWTDPKALDPSLKAAQVTREVAAHLASLAKALEETKKYESPEIATFLMRCLFTMFAEDVDLLPGHLFQKALAELWIPNPASFPGGLRTLWKAMNEGGQFGFVGKLLKFNGGLFKDQEVLPLEKVHLQLLLEAALCDWSNVEPSIFGTLLERALDAKERHRLGAHYTPRAYVERLVRPTIEEPLREAWENVQAEARALLAAPMKGKSGAVQVKEEAKRTKQARELVHAFHKKLCSTRVLDPACGTGNFLYVTLDLFKRLEGEVIHFLADLGEAQTLLGVDGQTVTPRQFLGIEIKPWAKEITDLVLWIGYLQWFRRTRRKGENPPEPVLQDYRNIECRDALIEYEGKEIALGEDGKPITRWDGETFKKSPVTGEDIPDETARVHEWKYPSPRRATWPEADYIVGNPPFVGNKRMRPVLGDGYVKSLRETCDDVPEAADFVMYWWQHAVGAVSKRTARRFGFITTNLALNVKSTALNVSWLIRRRTAPPLRPGAVAFGVPPAVRPCTSSRPTRSTKPLCGSRSMLRKVNRTFGPRSGSAR